MTTAFGKGIGARIVVDYDELTLTLTLTPNTLPTRAMTPAILRRLFRVLGDAATEDFGIEGTYEVLGQPPDMLKLEG